MRRLILPISRLDRRIAARAAQLRPRWLGILQAMGWTTDARVLIGLGLLRHGATQAGSQKRQRVRRFTLVIVLTTALHHAIKRLVDQRRPDRIERNDADKLRIGRPDDAFPSGHAMHAGAIASMAAHICPPAAPLIWTVAALVASSRIALLAHWTTGVIAGFGLGVSVERLTRRAPRRGLWQA